MFRYLVKRRRVEVTRSTSLLMMVAILLRECVKTNRCGAGIWQCDFKRRLLTGVGATMGLDKKLSRLAAPLSISWAKRAAAEPLFHLCSAGGAGPKSSHTGI